MNLLNLIEKVRKHSLKFVLLVIIRQISNILFGVLQVKLFTYIRYNSKIWLYRKAHLKLHRSCRLKIKKNGLRLGAPWEPIGHNFYSAFFDTHFVAYKNSYVEIDKKFVYIPVAFFVFRKMQGLSLAMMFCLIVLEWYTVMT